MERGPRPRQAQAARSGSKHCLAPNDVNAHYLRQGELQVVRLGCGYVWFDAGPHDSLIEASMFVQSLEKRQGLKVPCPEEIAFNQGWITKEELAREACKLGKSSYGRYLLQILEERD